MFVERLGLTACVSISSTSLFAIPLLFGLPSYSPARRLLPLFRFPNSELASLVARSIPQIADDAIPVTYQRVKEQLVAEPVA